MSDFSEGDTLKLVLFSDSHGNVANMADVVRLEHPDRVLHMGDLARDAAGPSVSRYSCDLCAGQL